MSKKAIVLMNMGGPNNLDEVKVFLTNMFNDKYILPMPKIIRYFVSRSIIKARLEEATSNYRKLGGCSPIVAHTKKLVKQLAKNVDADVFYEMRYTPPFSSEVLQKLEHYDEIFAIPLYPHYSKTTTKSSIEDFIKYAKKLNIEHKIKTIDKFYDNDFYNKAIIYNIKKSLKKYDAKEFTLVFSAHGLPQSMIDKGDLYQEHIHKHVKILKQELLKQRIVFLDIKLAYQSRVGKMEWIKPYLEDTLETLKGKQILIFPISFCVDNSETEFELNVEYREIAKEKGIKKYILAKAPNSNRYFIESLTQIYNDMIKS